MICSVLSKKKIYSKKKVKYIKVVFMYSHVSMDQIEKRSYTLQAGGNSFYGARCGYSCNYKEIANNLCSCESCKEKLSQGIDFDQCEICLNWNIMRGKYSEDCMNSNRRHSDRPFKLSIEMQLMKRQDACEKIVIDEVNKTNGTKNAQSSKLKRGDYQINNRSS